jgi:Phospholipase_D-nuclease N-terminal
MILGIAFIVGYLALVVYIAVDLFRRELNLVAKLAWVVAFLILPLLSVIFYAVSRGDDPRPYPGMGRPNVSN